MKLGEKLAKLRRDNNLTQEQLAQLLGVSRQAVSRWESDLAYPETEKLLRLGELYHCSMDYLLKDRPDSSVQTETPKPRGLRDLYFERRSARTVCGVPLWHINIGLGRTAKGIFSFGFTSCGVVSVGICSFGILSFGLFSLGAVGFGAIAAGLVAAGAIALGAVALGAISVGLLAIGALAIGEFAVGALALGHYGAIGDTVVMLGHAGEGVPVWLRWAADIFQWFAQW